MTAKCVMVAAGTVDDRIFSHICYVAENLATILPNFRFRHIRKSPESWALWVKETCRIYNWTHTKSPLIWREIGLTRVNATYIGSSYQFWEWLLKYYNIESHLNEEELNALQADCLFARKEGLLKKLPPTVPEKRRKIMIMGAGRTVCLDLVPQLVMMKELWLSHGTVVYLYDEPGCFFKLRKILKDSQGIGGGLKPVKIVEEIAEGLTDCDILIYLEVLLREDNEGTGCWLKRNYEMIERFCTHVNQHAPNYMKVIFCSFGLSCFHASIMQELAKKIPITNIVTVSAHFGLELIYAFVTHLNFSLRDFGCPPVWGYLGLNHFVDVHHMVQKCTSYQPNKRAVNANENMTLPLGIERSELRWFFYMSHNKNANQHTIERKALAQYQVGRSDDYQKCRAICDLLKLWYAENVGDEIISLAIASDGTFGIPEGLVFSQPVYLKVLEDQSRVWTPYKDFPMPHMPLQVFYNFIDTAVIITKIVKDSRTRSEDSINE